MKTKIKVFVKKIKNWLSSLSKWAQKHKLKIFTIICSSYLLISFMVTCNNNKNTAYAQTLTGNYLYLPSVEVVIQESSGTDGVTGYIKPFYIELNENGYPRRVWSDSTGFGELVGTIPIFNSTKGVYELNIPISWQFIAYNGSTEGYLNTSLIKTCYCTLFYSDYRSLYQGDIVLDIPTGSSYDPNGSNILRYRLKNANGNPVAYFSIYLAEYRLLQPNTVSEVSFYPTYLTLDPSIQADYDTIFSQGQSYGYDIGYNDGLTVGVGYANPFQFVVNSVNTFLSANLFGNISIADFISIAVGCILLGLIIKIFMGG